MNVIYFQGGLGNQMFQYALYQSMERYGKSKVKANISFYQKEKVHAGFELEKVFPKIELKKDENDIFTKRYSRYLKIRKKNDWIAFLNYRLPFLCLYFREKEGAAFDERLFLLRNAAVKGYWQSKEYAAIVEQVLLENFIFTYGEAELGNWHNRFLMDHQSVSIHIRRGDYLQETGLYGNLSESMYYNKAIDFFIGNMENPHFIFFSDDISWVKENYKLKDAIYIEPNMFEHYEGWYDMCLMSCCSHNIIANSSFSWWGAWLNKNQRKIVVAPERWLAGRDTPDIWCDGWIKM